MRSLVSCAVPLAVLLAATACEASPDMVPTTTPRDETKPTPPDQPDPMAALPKDAIRATEGTVATIGDCRCGIVSITKDEATIATFVPGWPETKQRLRPGQLLNACGTLHRVLAFKFGPSSGNPGGSGASVVIDRQPTTTVKLAPGAITLSIGGDLGPVGPGKVILKGLSITGQPGALVARFTARQDGNERAVEARVGDSLELGPARHKVLDLKAPDAALGIPGWIEIASTAN